MILKTGTVQNFEARFRKKDGDIGVGLVSASTVNLAGETHLLSIIKDVTETRKTQMALTESEEKFQSTLMAIGDGVIIIDRNMEITWANDIALTKFGPLTGRKCYEAIRGSAETCDGCNTSRTFDDGMIRTSEMSFNGNPGDGNHFLVTCSAVKNANGEITGVVETFKDITEIKKVEAKLLNSIHEKEILLKEIHHRVKNNLQSISGLLSIQAIRTEDPASKMAISESQNRILSMAVIHELLYQTDDLSRIDFAEYATKLAQHIKGSYIRGDTDVGVKTSGSEIFLNPDTAIPCSMILTELVSNAFKHAFDPGVRGKVTIQIEKKGDNRFCMTVQDNGKGLPPDLDVHTTETFGFTLIRTFIDLLKGNLELERGKETVFRIFFSEYEESKDLVV
jgi:PAS domain S-box-containing protein